MILNKNKKRRRSAQRNCVWSTSKRLSHQESC